MHPPSVNTPFYNHAATHMPKPLRPPPPIYQPEIVADAIYLAATSRRREVKVGGQTVAIAQSDDGDVQMGDRVTIVTDRNGVARAVRDTSGYRRDS